MRDIETARLGLHRSIESVPGFVAVYADARRNILEIRIEESAKLEAARQLPSTWGGYETIVTLQGPPIRYASERDYRGTWNR